MLNAPAGVQTGTGAGWRGIGPHDVSLTNACLCLRIDEVSPLSELASVLNAIRTVAQTPHVPRRSAADHVRAKEFFGGKQETAVSTVFAVDTLRFMQ